MNPRESNKGGGSHFELVHRVTYNSSLIYNALQSYFCMQDTFARARTRPCKRARDDRVYCIQSYFCTYKNMRDAV